MKIKFSKISIVLLILSVAMLISATVLFIINSSAKNELLGILIFCCFLTANILTIIAVLFRDFKCQKEKLSDNQKDKKND